MDKLRYNMKGKVMKVLRLKVPSRREVRNAPNGSQQCNDSFTR